jgi:putative ABC transport system substrate-binding protein
MRRRLIVALGAGAIAPGISWAQSAKRRPVIGVLRVNPRDTGETFLEPLRRELATLGWKENDNVEFAFAWAGGSIDALPKLAGDLVARGVDLIITFGPIGTRSAQKATSTIPIISMAEDLVGAGLVDNMARPGGNTTGISIFGTELNAKRLAILREATPGVKRIGALYEPTVTTSLVAVQAAAREMKIELVLAPAQTPAQIETAIKTLIKAKVGAVNVFASPTLNAFRARQIAAFAEARLPAIYEWPETAEQGGLLGYGPRIAVIYRQVIELANKVLRGAKPANLPVQQPVSIELVVNLKTAIQLGLRIPQSVLLQATRVVE